MVPMDTGSNLKSGGVGCSVVVLILTGVDVYVWKIKFKFLVLLDVKDSQTIYLL
jgi:hypothetical protein